MTNKSVTLLSALTEKQRRHIEALAVDPAARARFNGSTARIELLSVLAHPHRPEAAQIRGHLNAEFGLSITVEDLARALGISPEDMTAIEVGTKTTDDAGWTEIQTALFCLGSGKKPEHVADPRSDPSFLRALESCEDDPPVTAALSVDFEKAGQDEQLRAEVAKLRDVIVRANDMLFDVEDMDPEHTIECHADTLPGAYRRLAQGASGALVLLSAAVCEMVEPEAKR